MIVMTSLTHVRVVLDHTLPSNCKDQQSQNLLLILLISVFSLLSHHVLSK